MPRVGPVQSQDPRAFPRSPIWVTRAQTHGPSSATFPSSSALGWIEVEPLECELTRIQDAGTAGGSLFHHMETHSLLLQYCICLTCFPHFDRSNVGTGLRILRPGQHEHPYPYLSPVSRRHSRCLDCRDWCLLQDQKPTPTWRK